MLDFLKKKPKNVLPVEIDKEEQPWKPTITDSKLLAKKQEEFQKLIEKACEDGYISAIEYEQLRELTIQIGVNNTELADIIRIEFKKQLKHQVQLFADDGEVDKNEMKVLVSRANELGMTSNELQLLINEALSNHKEEVRKRIMAAVIAAGAVLVAAGAVTAKILIATADNGNMNISLGAMFKSTTIKHTK